jgi:carbonic anhydrase/acetyltransferase-like protein (isoleucine patch superfamily)
MTDRQHDTQYHPEWIDESVFLAPAVVVVGRVRIGPASSVWYHSVLRGDTESISIGSGTNIQDGCILHADPGFPCRLGDRVTVGHGAVVHGAEVADDVLIGIRSVVMNGARIGPGSIVGVGSVVTEGREIPANSLVLGLPGRVIRETTAEERQRILRTAEHYVQAARAYRDSQ